MNDRVGSPVDSIFNLFVGILKIANNILIPFQKEIKNRTPHSISPIYLILRTDRKYESLSRHCGSI